MFPNGTLSGSGLSSPCENPLYQTLDCNDAVSLIDTDDYSDSLDNATLTALICASSCEASIAQLHDSVSAKCGSSAELIPGMSFRVLVGQFWSSWNQSCFVDPKTGENCNSKKNAPICTGSPAINKLSPDATNNIDKIASFANVDSLSNISTSDLCSYCYVKKLELIQADAYSDTYNDD
ncbi:uncharacterized protein BO66DRAFT_433398 [Aspergillus aculeatinus CBS 121060]|uniref:Uncharacterized protein n=1 Tax=Aspergillus aculeatinus CBS 121060 TaxID=1448322 RepID=A0ACD1HNY1_9EURO|nr:hypothetical protein BO66DRAFT_433398 [Aspergillus aculeatinus CBS 121060]RAH75318.1 hypothetical protein BO66DRAFT_433398 [Aspergillus aculeatinus CBS 121060]